MGRANTVQTNFTSGELSPAMNGRVDVTKYFNGCQTLSNFYVKPQGGAYRRPGTKYLGEVKTSASATILVPFEFNNTQAYILELGANYLRIWEDGAVVTKSGPATLELTTPWGASDLAELRWAQSADILYIVHPDYQPRIIARSTSATVTGYTMDYQYQQLTGLTPYWGIGKFEFYNGPYLDESENSAGVTLSMYGGSAGTGYEKIWLYAFTVATGASLNHFTSSTGGSGGDINKYVEWRDNVTGKWRLGKISSFIDSTGTAVDSGAACPGVKVVPQPVKDIDERAFARAEAAAAGTIKVQFSYSNVAGQNDINKYIRVNGVWLKIQSLFAASPTDTPSSAAVLCTDPVPTMVTVSTPSQALRQSYIERTAYARASSATFVATDVGRWLRLNFSGKYVDGKISAYTSTTLVEIDLLPNTTANEFPLDDYDPLYLPDFGVTRRWQLGAWNSVQGWPLTVTFHEQRLVFAGNATQPQTIWMSESGDYNFFAPSNELGEVIDTSGVTYTIASNKVNKIVWLQSGTTLLVGTIGAEWQVKSSATAEPITPTNISILPQTAYGSIEGVPPARIGNATYYSQRSGRKLREMSYSFEQDSFQSKDMTVLSEHILRNGSYVIDAAYQPEPNSILWLALSDGSLAAMTVDREQEVYAWHRHSLGGSGIVESIACIPGDSELEWDLYLIVRRTINGSSKRFIERLAGEFNPSSATDKTSMIYLDCYATYSGAATTTPTGFSHLNGETVMVVADGAVVANATVAAGTFTLSTAASVVHVGKSYTSTLRTMPLEGGAQFGTSQGKTKRTDRVTVRLLNSIGLSHGSTSGALTELSFRDTSDAMNSSPPLFTGDKTFALNQSSDTDGSLYIVQTRAYPLNILLLAPEFVTHD